MFNTATFLKNVKFKLNAALQNRFLISPFNLSMSFLQSRMCLDFQFAWQNFTDPTLLHFFISVSLKIKAIHSPNQPKLLDFVSCFCYFASLRHILSQVDQLPYKLEQCQSSVLYQLSNNVSAAIPEQSNINSSQIVAVPKLQKNVYYRIHDFR